MLTYLVFLPFLTNRSDYRWLRVTKSGITGQPVPLFGLPRLETVSPHRRLDGVSLNLFTNLTQFLMAAFFYRRYACIGNSEALLPLYAGSDQPNPDG